MGTLTLGEDLKPTSRGGVSPPPNRSTTGFSTGLTDWGLSVALVRSLSRCSKSHRSCSSPSEEAGIFFSIQ
jgi:hypothetical protein